MPQGNESRTLTATTVAPTGAIIATVSGATAGFTHSAKAAQKASEVLSHNSSQRDSLLRSLKALFDEDFKFDNSVLETFPDDLREGLVATNDAIALTVKQLILGLSSGVGHLSQLPIDSVPIVTHTANNASHTEDQLSENIPAAISAASTFQPNNGVKSKHFSASIASVSGAYGKRIDKATAGIHDDFNVPDNSHAHSHEQLASIVAGGSLTLSAAPTAATAMVTDVIGHVSQEASVVRHCSAEESASRGEKNTYVATSGVAQATKDSDSQASRQKSRALEVALSHMQPAADLSSNQSIVAPLTSVLTRMVALSLFVESSRVTNFSAIETSNGRIQKALGDATRQGPCGGVDRINSLHSNLCSLSNIMRLCAENLGGASAIVTTAQSSEVLSSRSMSVALSHVSQLTEALSRLTSPQQENLPYPVESSHSYPHTNSTVDSANLKVLDRLEATIKEALDQIERDNHQPIIPGLNHDMASQLSSSTRTSIASSLLTHSLFINPSLLVSKGLNAATKTQDEQRNEALMATLPSMTQALNSIQAFTRNFMAEMEKAMQSGDRKNDGSLLSTHNASASNTATVYWATSGICLLSDELLSICRSLTLIDQNRRKAASKNIGDVPTNNESAQSTKQMAWDSHAGENESATAAITALRLTLSHTGVSLVHIALALDQALRENMDTVQANLAMHTLQQRLLTCSASASRYLAEGILFSTGGASALPVGAIGSVNSSHRSLHSTDGNLHPEPVHSSEKSSKGDRDSESSQSTGFSTDLIAGTVLNVLKVLSQSSLIGLDTSLELIKLLEIISLHRDSHIALQLETKASSNPNGVANNASVEPGAAVCVGTSALLINLLAELRSVDQCFETGSTLSAQDLLKNVIDQQIEGIATLQDEEEKHQNKTGLKEFYKIIICLLAPHTTLTDAQNLVKRFNCGGIQLSSYHSTFGAYTDQPMVEQNLLSQFANDDDAQGLLRQFIDSAKKDFRLLKLLHDQLSIKTTSQKAQALYDYVFEDVFLYYKQIKINDVIKFSCGSKRKPPTLATFKIDIGIEEVLTPIVKSHVIDGSDDPVQGAAAPFSNTNQ